MILKELKTERTLLRKLDYKDVFDLYEFASDSEVSKYLEWEAHCSISESRSFIEAAIEALANNIFFIWGIELQESKKLIGTVTITKWNRENANAEIGFILSRKYWNRGIMTEVVKSVVEFGFNDLLLNRIEARCHVENKASQALLEKVGFKKEGRLREISIINGKFVDFFIYSFLRNDRLNFANN